MGAVRTSEKSVNFNVATARYIPEDSKLHTRRRENVKSHIAEGSSENGSEPSCSIEVRGCGRSVVSEAVVQELPSKLQKVHVLGASFLRHYFL
jgi:hypothetical protein